MRQRLQLRLALESHLSASEWMGTPQWTCRMALRVSVDCLRWPLRRVVSEKKSEKDEFEGLTESEIKFIKKQRQRVGVWAVRQGDCSRPLVSLSVAVPVLPFTQDAEDVSKLASKSYRQKIDVRAGHGVLWRHRCSDVTCAWLGFVCFPSLAAGTEQAPGLPARA